MLTAQSFNNLIKGLAALHLSISSCAYGLSAASVCSAHAAFNWHLGSLLISSLTSGFTAPSFTNISWFVLFLCDNALTHAAVLACSRIELEPEMTSR